MKTVQAMNDGVTSVIHAGTGSSTGCAFRPRVVLLRHARRPPPGPRAELGQLAPEDQTSRRTTDATIATTARQPKCASMNGVSQPHSRATISTGGAAKWVSVPPIDTLTNSRPSVAYFSRADGCRS